MRFLIVFPSSLIILIAVAVIGASQKTPEPQVLYPAPQGAEEYIERGKLYEKAGAYDKALSDYEQAVQLNPDESHAYLGQGSALSSLNQPAAALEKYLIVKEMNQQSGKSTRILDELIARERAKL